jgi:hypothetical protein
VTQPQAMPPLTTLSAFPEAGKASTTFIQAHLSDVGTGIMLIPRLGQRHPLNRTFLRVQACYHGQHNSTRKDVGDVLVIPEDAVPSYWASQADNLVGVDSFNLHRILLADEPQNRPRHLRCIYFSTRFMTLTIVVLHENPFAWLIVEE